jgi:hypothetical protein
MPKSVESNLIHRMSDIVSYKKRMIKENFLTFGRCHEMLLPVLPGIVLIPFKPAAARQNILARHDKSIYHIYTFVKWKRSWQLSKSAKSAGGRRTKGPCVHT